MSTAGRLAGGESTHTVRSRYAASSPSPLPPPIAPPHSPRVLGIDLLQRLGHLGVPHRPLRLRLHHAAAAVVVAAAADRQALDLFHGGFDRRRHQGGGGGCCCCGCKASKQHGELTHESPMWQCDEPTERAAKQSASKGRWARPHVAGAAVLRPSQAHHLRLPRHRRRCLLLRQVEVEAGAARAAAVPQVMARVLPRQEQQQGAVAEVLQSSA